MFDLNILYHSENELVLYLSLLFDSISWIWLKAINAKLLVWSVRLANNATITQPKTP